MRTCENGCNGCDDCTDKQSFELIDGHTWVRRAPSFETIVALKSAEQASLSPGAYQVLTSAIGQAAALGPIGRLRYELRKVLATCASERCAPEIGARLEALLDAPEWTEAAEEANALRTSLAHWKVFGEHAEGERSQLSADVARLDRFEDWLADRAGPLLHIDQIKEALK